MLVTNSSLDGCSSDTWSDGEIMTMDNEISDFVTRIQTRDDLKSLRRDFEKTASNYGFPRFAYLGVKLPGRKHGDPLLVSTYPTDWTDHYMGQRYFTLDPVVIQAGQFNLPFTWGTKEMTGCLRGRQKRLLTKPRNSRFAVAAQFRYTVMAANLPP